MKMESQDETLKSTTTQSFFESLWKQQNIIFYTEYTLIILFIWNCFCWLLKSIAQRDHMLTTSSNKQITILISILLSWSSVDTPSQPPIWHTPSQCSGHCHPHLLEYCFCCPLHSPPLSSARALLHTSAQHRQPGQSFGDPLSMVIVDLAKLPLQ